MKYHYSTLWQLTQCMQAQTEIGNSWLQYSQLLAKQRCVANSIGNLLVLQWNWGQNNLSASAVSLPWSSVLSPCCFLYSHGYFLFYSPLRTSFRVPLHEAKTKPYFKVSRHPNKRRNSLNSNTICSFWHLFLLFSEQNGRHGWCQTYAWLWCNRKWNK